MKNITINRQLKIKIAKKIKKLKLKRAGDNQGLVEIPGIEDSSGKPLVVPNVVFNKIYDNTVQRQQ